MKSDLDLILEKLEKMRLKKTVPEFSKDHSLFLFLFDDINRATNWAKCFTLY